MAQPARRGKLSVGRLYDEAAAVLLGGPARTAACGRPQPARRRAKRAALEVVEKVITVLLCEVVAEGWILPPNGLPSHAASPP